MQSNARALRHLAFGPVATTQWYNRVVASLAGHIGQLVPPDTWAIRSELAALAIATASPCGAMPPKLLANLKLVGILPQYVSIGRTSAAARLRVAMAEPLFIELERLHRDMDNGIDRLEAPPMRAWIR